MENNLQTVENKNNLMVNDDDGSNMIAQLTESTLEFCTMKADTQDEKIKLFNAMNNPDGRLADEINKQITVKDVFVEMVELVHEETGEVAVVPRIVLIDIKGKSYACVSIGIYSALKKLFRIFGVPTWHDGVKLEIKQISKGERKMLTINAV